MLQELEYDLKTTLLGLGLVQEYPALALEMNQKNKKAETLRAFTNASYVFTDLSSETDGCNEYPKSPRNVHANFAWSCEMSNMDHQIQYMDYAMNL